MQTGSQRKRPRLANNVNLRRINWHATSNWIATWKEGGQSRQRFFRIKTDGETFKAEKESELKKSGNERQIKEADRQAILEYSERLAKLDLTVADALKMAVEAQERVKRSASVSKLVGEVVEAKEREGLSARYLGDLRQRLRLFEATFGDRPVASIETAEISDWLDSLNVAPITVGNVRRLLLLLFNEGKRRRYCEANPVSDAIKPKVIESEIGIVSPAQAAALLEHAADSILPVIAIGLFAGLREAELKRLDWSEVDLIGGHIEVTAAKAKSARRRLIKIQPNLAEWLSPCAKRSGPVWPVNGRKLLEAARRSAGFNTEVQPAWPHNAARHSFASYHLSKFKDAAALALELGHTDTGIIFAHYRELVRPAQADAFWSIEPATAENVTRIAG